MALEMLDKTPSTERTLGFQGSGEKGVNERECSGALADVAGWMENVAIPAPAGSDADKPLMPLWSQRHHPLTIYPPNKPRAGRHVDISTTDAMN